jgi:hypothetical protein
VGKGRKEEGLKICPRLFFFLPSVKPSLTNNSMLIVNLVFSFFFGLVYCGLILFTQLQVAKGPELLTKTQLPIVAAKLY